MLRLSTAFVRTLRDDPSDAEVPSHRLLLRGSYVRRVGPGIYSWLPLGLRVLRKVEAIVREEMDRIGSQEVLLPALLPREPYERTGRWTEYGDSLFRLQDRRDADYLLGPTHEEIFTLMVKGELGSYNDFPVQLFQIQNKYRDEARPRGGILRGREFLMKDAYSFDIDEAGLQASYDAYRGAYVRIFERLGIEAVPVSATAGAMGGSASEEFLAPCDVGEDTFVRCTTGDYAANVEAVTFPPPAPITTVAPEPRRITTPGAKTLDKLLVSLAEALPAETFTRAQLLKHVLVVLRHPDGTTEPLAVGIPGDRELDLKRLEAQVAPAEVGLFDRETFEAHPTLVAGFIGPGVLGTAAASGVRYLVDPRVSEGTVWVSGADVVDEHLVDLQVGRDIRPDGTIEAVEVLEGDPCPVCGGTLRIDRGIEVGHVFQLGPKYAEALGLQASGADNALSTITMGSYGIGISRAVASIVEQHHDERGILWPASVAPYDVHVVIAGKKPEIVEKGEELAASLEAAGLDVLLDDRASGSVGVKLTDAELLGVPVIVVVGRRATEEIAEVRFRADATVEELAFADVAAAVRRPTA